MTSTTTAYKTVAARLRFKVTNTMMAGTISNRETSRPAHKVVGREVSRLWRGPQFGLANIKRCLPTQTDGNVNDDGRDCGPTGPPHSALVERDARCVCPNASSHFIRSI